MLTKLQIKNFQIHDSKTIEFDPVTLKAEAVEWSMTRGARNGRVAWQFIQDLAGRQGVRLG